MAASGGVKCIPQPQTINTKLDKATTEPAATENKQLKFRWIFRDPLTVYNFVRELGSGHFGTTHLVVKRATGEEFACKVINKHQRDYRTKAVLKEVEILRLLAPFPHVTTLYEVWEDKNYVYLVQELCRGGELFEMILSRGHLTERDAAAVVKIIFEVLKECHSKGVLHRDLKPENFLLKNVVSEGQSICANDVRAIDFGLSVILKPGETRHDLAGSSYYMAPDVLQGKYSWPADVWSAGVIMYVMLSGMPPFWGKTDKEILSRVLNEDVDLDVEPWPEMSSTCKDLLRKLLVRDPDQRLSVDEALQHPWIKLHATQPTIPINSTVFHRMRKFTQLTKLKHLLLNLVAKHLTDDAIGNLRRMFESMDADGSGTIEFSELQRALAEVGVRVNSEELMRLVGQLDVSHHGYIEYDNFIAAAIDKKRVLTDRRLNHIFATLDVNKDGYLGVDELRAALAECHISVDTRVLKEMLMKEGAADKKGLVSPHSFMDLMRSIADEDLVPAHLDEIVSSITRFVHSNHFRQLALMVIARNMDADEVTDLRLLFEQIDEAGSGSITLQQLKTAVERSGCKLAESELNDLFSGVDVNHDGCIGYHEFLAATLEQHHAITEQKLRAAFEFFDQDGDGFISRAELRMALEDLMMEPDEADQLILLADENADHIISFVEFQHLMSQTTKPNIATSLPGTPRAVPPPGSSPLVDLLYNVEHKWMGSCMSGVS